MESKHPKKIKGNYLAEDFLQSFSVWDNLLQLYCSSQSLIVYCLGSLELSCGFEFV